MVSLLAILGSVPDPRTGNAQRHALLDMLVIALAASVCGAESCVDFAEFGEDRQELLREFLSLENGLPRHDTFSRLFRLLDPAAFGRALAAFLDDLGADGPGVMAIDGKTLRRSFDRAAGRSPLHVVTAFGPEARLVIGQSAVVPGGNEITAARALLETLCLQGVLVTADALHTQTETAALVRERGGDYLFALKGNHPLLAAEVAEFFADPEQNLETYQTVDTDHGRIKTRTHRVSHAVDYLSSARLSPERFAAAVRAHWAIENALHWVLDVTFDEDRARNRKDNGPENLTILRKLTLTLLRTARPKLPVPRKRKRAGWSDTFARSVIGQMR